MYSLCFRIVFRPNPFKLIQVVGPKNRPITRQIVKVVHDDRYKQVNDLQQDTRSFFTLFYSFSHEYNQQAGCVEYYQKSTEHVEADEVNDSKAAAAGPLLAGVVVRLRITQFPGQTGQHDLLPGLTCGTSKRGQHNVIIFYQNKIK